MVNFKNKIDSINAPVDTNPISIYDKLDRKSEKSGNLRPAQESVLKDWFDSRQNDSDVILKMNTGSGKTITGLLMLESRRLKNNKMQVYLCNTVNLVLQTIRQAEEFGIKYCVIESPSNVIPSDASLGRKILITTVNKLFNGKSIFGIENKSIKIDGLVLDDAHTSTEIIKSNMQIHITRSKHQQLYNEIFELFDESIQSQGNGTYFDIINYDIKQKSPEPFLPVPYWDWQKKLDSITSILSKYASNTNEITFVWPILRDNLKFCTCVISPTGIEIVPFVYPIEMFESYYTANQRIFMSATTSTDTTLIKDLQVKKSAIKNPLIYKNERWSGEKLVVIPSLISPNNLQRFNIVQYFGSKKNSRFGIVAISPSYFNTEDWKAYGAKIATKDSLEKDLQMLNAPIKTDPLVLVNRYDGIDLPDDRCRILIIDGLPRAQTLYDKYIDKITKNSTEYKIRITQKIEQAMGRSVRADTDYSVILLIGSDLIKFIRNDAEQVLSAQARKQIQIGMEVSSETQDEIYNNDTEITAKKALVDLISNSYNRNESWKTYYRMEMDNIDYSKPQFTNLERLQQENNLFKRGINPTIDIQEYNQQFLKFVSDNHEITDEEQAWYLQFLATVNYQFSTQKSFEFQLQAYNLNKKLLLPPVNQQSKLIEGPIRQQRLKNISITLAQFDTFEKLRNYTDDVINNLQFGVKKDDFETAVDDLGKLLGFVTDRPDEYQKKGPDHVWAIDKGKYFAIEDKSEVSTTRNEIYKSETGQMNNSQAWMNENYKNTEIHYFMVIPVKYLQSGAGFANPVLIIRKQGLKKIRKSLTQFINEFSKINLKSIDESFIQSNLVQYNLTPEFFLKEIGEVPVLNASSKSR